MSKDIMKYFFKAHFEVKKVYEINIKKGAISEGTKTFPVTCGILIPISGRAVYHVNEVAYKLDGNKVLQAGPDMPLNKYVGVDRDWHYYLIHYKVKGKDKVKSFIDNLVLLSSINESQMLKLRDLAKKLYELHQGSKKNQSLRKQILLLEILDLVLEARREKDLVTEGDKVDYVLNYIHDHVNEVLKVGELADLVDMPVKRFCYLFQKITGTSPKKYITRVKVHRAESLLLNTDSTITEIAISMGYEDQFYFSRFFKKQTGHAPSDFRVRVGKSPS